MNKSIANVMIIIAIIICLPLLFMFLFSIPMLFKEGSALIWLFVLSFLAIPSLIIAAMRKKMKEDHSTAFGLSLIAICITIILSFIV